jgi:PRTRC genetic system ThiF family protein
MSRIFRQPEDWLGRALCIPVIGAGGTGSELFDGLALIHRALRKLDNPHGLDLTLIDADTVSPANTGRQRYYEHDIGENKAITSVQRQNITNHVHWRAVPRMWNRTQVKLLEEADIVVSCVDSAAVRAEIAEAGKHCPHTLWLDFGNGASTGQCVLGHLGATRPPAVDGSIPLRLPHALDLYRAAPAPAADTTPSCSLAEALAQQDLFINRVLANAGLAILWNLIHHGAIEAHGSIVDVRTGITVPIMIDEAVWADFGYTPAELPPLQQDQALAA